MWRLRLDLLTLLTLPTAVMVAADQVKGPDQASTSTMATADDTASVPPAEDEVPQYPDLPVLFIVDWTYPGAEAELRRLEGAGGVFEKLRNEGWRIGVHKGNHLRIVTVDEVRPLVQRLDLKVYPAVIAYQGNEVIRSFRSGCATPLDEYTFKWMRTGVSSRPTDSPKATVTVEGSGSYPLRGAHWSVEGSYSPTREQVLLHLTGGNHRHLIPDDWPIDCWSDEELRSLHDDLHEQSRPRKLVQKLASDGLRPVTTPQPAQRSYYRYQVTP